MTSDQRNEYRLSLLKDLYDEHFKHGGSAITVKVEKDGKIDQELVTALQYLDDKRLLDSKILHRGAYQARITAYGIDLIETGGNLR
ncbi:hypothetical protein [Brevibacillus sp. H7]|uniref:hypothetical protein n=1 Tax=Brevibacillus sp. H7 TaxID=3349138 RepID=UPI00382DA9B5